MTEEENLRRDIRKVIVDIHDNLSEDEDHYFDVLAEYVVGMLTMSAEITSRLILEQDDGT